MRADAVLGGWGGKDRGLLRDIVRGTRFKFRAVRHLGALRVKSGARGKVRLGCGLVR